VIRTVAIVVLLGTTAAAEPRDEIVRGSADAAEAKQQSKEGSTRYRSGDFVAAATAFARAYELGGPAPLLFNLAQAHRRAGDCFKAHVYYTRFLAEVPVDKNRPLAERHRRALAGCANRAVVEVKPQDSESTPAAVKPDTRPLQPIPIVKTDAPRRNEPETPTVPSATPPDDPGTRAKPTEARPDLSLRTETRTSPLRTIGWVTAGIGLAGLITGFALSCDDCDDQAVPGRPFVLGGGAMLTVGVGLAIWGHARTRTVVVPRASGAVVSRSWSF
jgi:hypothetical protein